MTSTPIWMMTEREPEELDSEEQKIAEIFSILVETGALELMGLDEDSEPLYRVTARCQEVFPDFYKMYTQELNATAAELWQMGVVEVNFTTNGETSILFTADNYSMYRKLRGELTPDQLSFLQAVVGSNLGNLDFHL